MYKWAGFSSTCLDLTELVLAFRKFRSAPCVSHFSETSSYMSSSHQIFESLRAVSGNTPCPVPHLGSKLTHSHFCPHSMDTAQYHMAILNISGMRKYTPPMKLRVSGGKE